MKKTIKIVTAAIASVLAATSASAVDVSLYSLDNRVIAVDESEVDLYIAEGMGWFLEKPVEMYSADGRTIIVPADAVEAHEKVGWFKEKPSPEKDDDIVTGESSASEKESKPAEKVSITLPDGPTITVPAEQVEIYESLGWVLTGEKVTPEAPLELMVVYNAEGAEKEIDVKTLENMKAQGWYPAKDEAIYAFAAFGDLNTDGAVKLMENKQYDKALALVQDAVLKLENTNSEYTSMLYYLRSQVTDAWREDEGAPIAFISSEFKKIDGKNAVVIEFKNISNNRIKGFEVNFDVCNEKGEVVETNEGVYLVKNVEMKPYSNKRITWGTQTGGEKYGIKNLRVLKVTFVDGTTWEKA